ncbi:MAG: SDR family oxidoreductase [Wenzhouxiangella sp.]|nr:SDR family oxidoreductase [Wenzhouxiangella sp.]MCH8478612.1 SDR family oxidoreductase [Wenzhouxiangella sp.]
MAGASIFITGAGSGIGRATARLFAERGWFVGLYDLNADAVEELAGELNGAACHSALDVTDAAAFEAAVAHFGEHTEGRMAVLFNCAGVMRMGTLDQVDLADQVRTIRVNFEAVVIGIYCALPLLRETPDAMVLSMSSASAFYGVPELAVYSASKFAVRGLTEGLSIELEREGIRVADIMPLYVNTPLVTEQQNPLASIDRLGTHHRPEEIAELAWRAVQGKRVHWVAGWRLRILSQLGGFLPFLKRPIMKRVSRR